MLVAVATVPTRDAEEQLASIFASAWLRHRIVDISGISSSTAAPTFAFLLPWH